MRGQSPPHSCGRRPHDRIEVVARVAVRVLERVRVPVLERHGDLNVRRVLALLQPLRVPLAVLAVHVRVLGGRLAVAAPAGVPVQIDCEKRSVRPRALGKSPRPDALFGDQQSRPAWGRAPLASVAPASHSARSSVAITAPRPYARERFHEKPKLTGLHPCWCFFFPLPAHAKMDSLGERRGALGRAVREQRARRLDAVEAVYAPIILRHADATDVVRRAVLAAAENPALWPTLTTIPTCHPSPVPCSQERRDV